MQAISTPDMVKDFDNKVDTLSLKPFEYNGIFYVHEYNTPIYDSVIMVSQEGIPYIQI